MKNQMKLKVLAVLLVLNLGFQDVAALKCKGKPHALQGYAVGCQYQGNSEPEGDESASCLYAERADAMSKTCTTSCNEVNVKIDDGQFKDTKMMMWSFSGCYEQNLEVLICAGEAMVTTTDAPTTTEEPTTTMPPTADTTTTGETTTGQSTTAAPTTTTGPVTSGPTTTPAGPTTTTPPATTGPSTTTGPTTTVPNVPTTTTQDVPTTSTDAATTTTTALTSTATTSTATTTATTSTATTSTATTTTATTTTAGAQTASGAPTTTAAPTTSAASTSAASTTTGQSTTAASTTAAGPTTTTAAPTTSAASTSAASTTTGQSTTAASTTAAGPTTTEEPPTTTEALPEFEGCWGATVNFVAATCTAEEVTATLENSHGNATVTVTVYNVGCCDDEDNCQVDDGVTRDYTCRYTSADGSVTNGVPCDKGCFTVIRPVFGTQHGCLSDLDLTNTPYEDDNINDCTEALQNGGCIKAGGAESCFRCCKDGDNCNNWTMDNIVPDSASSLTASLLLMCAALLFGGW